jgi:hypothetical protein
MLVRHNIQSVAQNSPNDVKHNYIIDRHLQKLYGNLLIIFAPRNCGAKRRFWASGMVFEPIPRLPSLRFALSPSSR